MHMPLELKATRGIRNMSAQPHGGRKLHITSASNHGLDAVSVV